MPTKNRLIALAVIAILGAGVSAGDLIAQDPSKPRPTRITIPTKEPILAPQPIAKPSVSDRVSIVPQALPDLELTLRPSSSTSFPSEFIVKNSGRGDSRNASLLSVTLDLLPMTLADYRRVYIALYGLPEDGLGGTRVEVFSTMLAQQCGYPYPDFQAAIDPLAPGETQRISESGARVGRGIRPLGPVATVPTRVQDHSYIEQTEIRLVCVYEVQATVDANGEVAESNERNNEVIHIYQRKVTLR